MIDYYWYKYGCTQEYYSCFVTGAEVKGFARFMNTCSFLCFLSVRHVCFGLRSFSVFSQWDMSALASDLSMYSLSETSALVPQIFQCIILSVRDMFAFASDLSIYSLSEICLFWPQIFQCILSETCQLWSWIFLWMHYSNPIWHYFLRVGSFIP